MKFKNLFLAGLALMSITACSNDDDPIKGGSGENANAYMQLVLTGTEQSSTKTEGSSSSDSKDTDPKQSKITNALVLLCSNDAERTVQSTQEISGIVDKGSGNYETPVFRINCTAGTTYKVYVIANYNSANSVFTTLTGQNINEVVTQVSAITAENDVTTKFAADNKFLMFNQSKGNDDYEGPTITINADNNTTMNPAKPASTINLDRLAAKIRSQVKTDGGGLIITDVKTQYSNISAVALKGFKLFNGVKNMNLQQKWAFANGTTGENTLITTDVTKANYYNSFAQFAEVTRTSAPSVHPEVYSAVLDKTGDLSSTTDVYCLENNSSATTAATYTGQKAKRNNTTGLLYQFQVTLTYGGKSGGESSFGANTFFSYNNKFYNTLNALKTEYPNAFAANEQTGTKNQYNTACTELAGATINGTPDQAKISAFRSKYNIKVYTNGIMYYIHYIKDTNYKQLKEGKSINGSDNIENTYSIFRNTVYDLTIQSLKKIGTDVPGGWDPYVDPDGEVETTDLFMQVEVKVNPWVLSSQDIDLQ